MIERFTFELFHCNGGDMTPDAEGEYVSYEDYVELQQKLDAMAVDNAGLKDAILTAKEELQEHYDTDGVDSQDSEGNFMDACIRLCDAQSTIEKLENIKTPTTDAYLNSVRAEVLNELCIAFVQHAELALLADDEKITLRECTNAVLHCAEQLRSGTHDTADEEI